MSNNDKVWVAIEVHETTDDAILVDEAESTWVPKRQISDLDGDVDRVDDLERGDTAKIEIPEWLAFRKGLI